MTKKASVRILNVKHKSLRYYKHMNVVPYTSGGSKVYSPTLYSKSEVSLPQA